MAFLTVLAGLWRRMALLDPFDPFDPEFYRSRYPDLDHFSPRELRRHYLQFGRDEGRLSSAAGLTSKLEGTTAPSDFDARNYLQLNRDLVELGFSEVQATLHYVEHGAREQRPHKQVNPTVYRELYFEGVQISDASLERHYFEVGRLHGRIGSAAELLASEGVAGAFWADSIRLHEFALLNWSWAGKVDRYVDAARLMVREGVGRLAPLSFDLHFDVDFYRETHPNLSGLSDEALYRRWLWNERACTPASPEHHLRRLGLALRAYPPGFRWREYARTQPGLKHRWAALDHLVRRGAPGDLVPPVEGPEGGAFLVAVGQTVAFKDDRGALRLLEAARSLSGLDAQALQLLGDCYYRLELWTAAYEAYADVARSPEASVWSFCNAARAAIKLEQPEQALEMLALGKDGFAGEQIWRKVVQEGIQAEFEKSWVEAESLYRSGDRAEADAIMSQAAQRSGERWTEFDPLGAPLAPHVDGRVVVLANVDLSQCTHYRVDQKAALFETLGRPYGIYTQAQTDEFLTALPGASAAIFYRLPALPRNVRAIQAARALGVPTYYDIDDLIFDAAAYPEPRDTYAESVSDHFYASLQLGVPLFRAAMAMCDQGIASTTDLARHMEKVVRSGVVHVLPNGLDHTNQFYLEHTPTRGRCDEEFVIFYGSGTKAHNSDFLDLAGRALRTVMQRHAHVRLMVVGYLELDDSFDALRERITYMDWIPNLEAYWSILAEADLNIAVLADHATTNAKSEIKWLEAAVLGLPSIVSATHRYREVLEDGVDALLASDVEEWTLALERMITDPALRARLTSNARKKLRRAYVLERNAYNLDALLPKLPATPARGGGRKRVLLLNLFFPPQTYGGSTRVARDNLDFFLSHAGDEYEFAVVTTDLGAEVPYLLRVEDYRGAPVFRISPPIGPSLEWGYDDPGMRQMFSDILDIWAPDLVHFHCVQRITAAAVDVCRERSIPYINSLHDAYWLSDFHFLCDDKDQLRPPNESWPLEPLPPFTVGDSLQRRRFLHPLLRDSAEILGVSESFTELHRACGFERAVCVANGAPPLPKAPRSRSSSGRVRLAQVGSQTYFKGYHHIQAALRQSRFSNVELTVVDHTRFGGPIETTLWGTTPVRFVGKTKQEQMHHFYTGQDVLVAPSLWPESFGLVAREALGAGLWVLASDRGAIGEDVAAGRNGWVVDVSTPQGVIAALAEIDADPERYRVSPPSPEPPLRTSDDQARDLLAIYRDVLSRPRPQPKRFFAGPMAPKPKWSLKARAEAARPAPANP